MSKSHKHDGPVIGATLATKFGSPCHDPIWDATNGACPAWWRGNDDGVTALCHAINKMLDGHEPGGRFGGKLLRHTLERIRAMRDLYFDTLPVDVIEVEATKVEDGKVIYLPGPVPCNQ